MVMAVTGFAGPSEPGAAAVCFLEKVRAANLNLEPGGDTALAPQTSAQKRREIARRLERLGSDLGRDPLEVGAVKLDDDVAAVLVRKTGGFDSSQWQVVPVAMVRRGEEWIAAPVLASFENTDTGYSAMVRKRLATLEDWMLREQVLDLEKLREQSAERMRRKIAESLPFATLRSFTPAQAAARFLSACGQRNPPEILGLIGGLSPTLPHDWPLRLKAVDTAVAAASEVKHPWRLLMAAEVLRALVHHDEDGDRALVSIACLDPARSRPHATRPGIELVHLELSKTTDGCWRIDLPGNFLQDEENPGNVTDANPDPDLLDAFPAKLAALYPPSPQPTAEQARKNLLATLQSANPSALMRCIRLDGDSAAARKACVRAAHIWWALRDPSCVRNAVPLAIHEDASHAAAACQFFSARDPDQLDLRILYFEKQADGWLWTPEPLPETEKSLRAWTDSVQAKRWQDEWQSLILAECPKLESLPESGAPAEEDARKLIDSWLRAIRAGDVMAALRHTARLHTPESSSTLLRNLGYEMTGARRHRKIPTVTSVRRSGIWTTVSTQADPDNTALGPIYPVIATPAGPRILLEIDWVASPNRSRDFLNKTALERLRKVNVPAADALQKLFAEHHNQNTEAPEP
jgi:hypothetical protein